MEIQRERKVIDEEKSCILLAYTEKKITGVWVPKSIPRIEPNSRPILSITGIYETSVESRESL